jgi:DNA gyrase subunit A
MTSRDTKGVKTMNLTYKTGSLVAVRNVNGDEDLMIITSGGVIIRISVSDISLYSRNAQGVKLINVGENEVVSKVAIVEKSEEAATSDVEESDNEEKIDNPEKE